MCSTQIVSASQQRAMPKLWYKGPRSGYQGTEEMLSVATGYKDTIVKNQRLFSIYWFKLLLILRYGIPPKFLCYVSFSESTKWANFNVL